MEKLFLIDAYALIYRAYYAFIKNPRINSKGFNTSAIYGFVNTLEELLRTQNPTHLAVAFDPAGPTFRHRAYEQYKAQREETPEAIRLSVPVIKEIIAAYRIPIVEVSDFEADDVIGTLARQADEMGIRTYMMTPDKDYGQLVTDNVSMYRPMYGDKEYEVMTPQRVKEKYGIEETRQIIDLLGLMGDASDNIPGCPGVGEKTAQKLVAEFGSIETLLESTDRLKGALKKKVEENREKILFSKFLATIRTDVPITLDMKKLERQQPDSPTLLKIFDEYEMRALKERVLKSTGTAADLFAPAPATGDLFAQAAAAPAQERKGPQQGDLFANFAGRGTENSENSTHLRINDLDVNYQLVDTEEKIKEFVNIYESAEILSVDTETTSTDAINAKLVGISLSIAPESGCYIPVPTDDEEGVLKIVNMLRPLLENEKTLKVGQNIKYDLTVLANYGVQVAGPLFDTMIAHYVLQPELPHGMDYLAEIYLNYQTIHIEELIGPRGKGQRNMRDLPAQEIYRYACEDADITLKLKEVLQRELEEKGAADLFYKIEMPLVRVLCDMERNGVRIESGALAETSRHLTERMKQIEEQVYQSAGCTFNISSPKQVGEVLFQKLKIVEKPRKTKTGQFVTSEEVLEELKHKHPVVEQILDYRGLKKLLSTYVDALPQLVNPRTGKIHTSFNQTVTATGRLSSSNPNLQNIPIRNEDGKEIRKVFVPEAGCRFFSADYSQIELRIMAHLSGDRNMIEDFRSGYDIHAATAAKIYHKPIGEVSSDERRKAKTANFGIIYGISAFGLAERMNVSRYEAKELIESYFATYPQIKEYIAQCIQKARELGYVETVCHRKRYLPDIESRNAVVRGYAERNAVNAPIQGSAADIIKIAMINIRRRFIEEGLHSQMILQVHDELNFSVCPGEEEAVERIVTQEMEQAYPMSVPLKADCGWGDNWLQAH